MDRGRLGGIVSALRNYELTSLERQFLGRVKEHFEKNGQLNEEQESILEGIYMEKLRWRKTGIQGKEAFPVKRAI